MLVEYANTIYQYCPNKSTLVSSYFSMECVCTGEVTPANSLWVLQNGIFGNINAFYAALVRHTRSWQHKTTFARYN
jgi:hypothetical protein